MTTEPNGRAWFPLGVKNAKCAMAYCRLGVKGSDDGFRFFNTKEELMTIVS